jgi:hypothetical protein
MDKDDYYKTVRTARVTKSKDDRFELGEYPVYMNYTSTWGIFGKGEVFMPLRISCMFGIEWEYVRNE